VEGNKLGVGSICAMSSQAGLPVASSTYYAVKTRERSVRASTPLPSYGRRYASCGRPRAVPATT
jgi:hypothetical protein